MNDIILPPKKKSSSKQPMPGLRPVSPTVEPVRTVVQHQPIMASEPPRKKRRIRKLFAKRPILWTLVVLIVAVVGAASACIGWYSVQLGPASHDKQILVAVDIPLGTSPSDIGKLLAEKTLIKSSLAFDVYTNITGVRSKLQAGTYRLSPSDSTPEIVDHLVNGKADQFQITFLPGATLDQHKNVLRKAGYSSQEIDEAFSRSYDSPLFQGASSSDFEGYIYGETYSFGVGADVSDILQFVFDEYYSVIQKNDLINGFARQGLSLREGITLASIVQREAGSNRDMAQIAQVFLLRLKIGMNLGSDVTYQYIADKLGLPRDTNLNNPYNTRRFAGLPPGPIASPGENALRAVAQPAEGNYLFFLSGDDDVTYFAYTDAEHQQNIADHCKIKCSTL